MFVPTHARSYGEPQTLTPSAKNLAYLLRHRELWPKDFGWSYYSYRTCAMGLAHRVWGVGTYGGGLPGFTIDVELMSKALHMKLRSAERIFLEGNRSWFGWGVKRVEPHQIAAALERVSC